MSGISGSELVVTALIWSKHLKAVARATVHAALMRQRMKTASDPQCFRIDQGTWTWIRFTKPIISRLSPIYKVPFLAFQTGGDSAMRGGRTTERSTWSAAISSSLVP
jgi:hypothetical protein